MTGEPPRTHIFRSRHRLSLTDEYRTVYRQGVRRSAGPISIFLLPNHRPDHRLGLSVGRRMGNAVARNRFKRLLREAFRLERPALPAASSGAFDIVVVLRPHRPLPLEGYRSVLATLIAKATAESARREAPDGAP